MLKQLTPPASIALHLASERARQAGELELLPRHLLAVLTAEPDSTSSRLLRESGVVLPSSREAYEVEMVVTDDPHKPGSTALPEEASRLLERARQLAEEMNHPLVGTEHLLIVVLEQPEVEEWGPLKSRGVRASAVRAKLFGG